MTARHIIAFEALAQGCSICVGTADGDVWDKKNIDGFSAKHQLVSVINDYVEEHGTPKALACAVGPGSFTGLRVACIAARSLAWAWQLPVYNVNSMVALTAEHGDGRYVCLMPLKKDTTFIAAYEINADHVSELLPVTPYLDANIPALPDLGDYQLVGPALHSKAHLIHDWSLQQNILSDAAVNAVTVLRACKLSTLVDWEAVLPAYHQASAPELQRAQQS